MGDRDKEREYLTLAKNILKDLFGEQCPDYQYFDRQCKWYSQLSLFQMWYDNNFMPKQVIINMEAQYPFGECEEGDDQSVRILVRKKMDLNISNRDGLFTRANFFRRLNQSCIIKL